MKLYVITEVRLDNVGITQTPVVISASRNKNKILGEFEAWYQTYSEWGWCLDAGRDWYSFRDMQHGSMEEIIRSYQEIETT